jgi:hypothetical protein
MGLSHGINKPGDATWLLSETKADVREFTIDPDDMITNLRGFLQLPVRLLICTIGVVSRMVSYDDIPSYALPWRTHVLYLEEAQQMRDVAAVERVMREGALLVAVGDRNQTGSVIVRGGRDQDLESLACTQVPPLLNNLPLQDPESFTDSAAGMARTLSLVDLIEPAQQGMLTKEHLKDHPEDLAWLATVVKKAGVRVTAAQAWWMEAGPLSLVALRVEYRYPPKHAALMELRYSAGLEAPCMPHHLAHFAFDGLGPAGGDLNVSTIGHYVTIIIVRSEYTGQRGQMFSAEKGRLVDRQVESWARDQADPMGSGGCPFAVSLIAGIALRLSAALKHEPWTRKVGVAAFLRVTVNKLEADILKGAPQEGPAQDEKHQPRGAMTREQRERFAAFGIELRAALNVLSLQYPFFLLYLEKLNLEVWNTQMLTTALSRAEAGMIWVVPDRVMDESLSSPWTAPGVWLVKFLASQGCVIRDLRQHGVNERASAELIDDIVKGFAAMHTKEVTAEQVRGGIRRAAAGTPPGAYPKGHALRAATPNEAFAVGQRAVIHVPLEEEERIQAATGAFRAEAKSCWEGTARMALVLRNASLLKGKWGRIQFGNKKAALKWAHPLGIAHLMLLEVGAEVPRRAAPAWVVATLLAYRWNLMPPEVQTEALESFRVSSPLGRPMPAGLHPGQPEWWETKIATASTDPRREGPTHLNVADSDKGAKGPGAKIQTLPEFNAVTMWMPLGFAALLLTADSRTPRGYDVEVAHHGYNVLPWIATVQADVVADAARAAAEVGVQACREAAAANPLKWRAAIARLTASHACKFMPFRDQQGLVRPAEFDIKDDWLLDLGPPAWALSGIQHAGPVEITAVLPHMTRSSEGPERFDLPQVFSGKTVLRGHIDRVHNKGLSESAARTEGIETWLMQASPSLEVIELWCNPPDSPPPFSWHFAVWCGKFERIANLRNCLGALRTVMDRSKWDITHRQALGINRLEAAARGNVPPMLTAFLAWSPGGRRQEEDPVDAEEDQQAFQAQLTELRNYWDYGQDRSGRLLAGMAPPSQHELVTVTASFVEEACKGAIDAAGTMAQGGAREQWDAFATALGQGEGVAIAICGARGGGEIARRVARPLVDVLSAPRGEQHQAEALRKAFEGVDAQVREEGGGGAPGPRCLGDRGGG